LPAAPFAGCRSPGAWPDPMPWDTPHFAASGEWMQCTGGELKEDHRWTSKFREAWYLHAGRAWGRDEFWKT